MGVGKIWGLPRIWCATWRRTARW